MFPPLGRKGGGRQGLLHDFSGRVGPHHPGFRGLAALQGAREPGREQGLEAGFSP